LRSDVSDLSSNVDGIRSDLKAMRRLLKAIATTN
jgi:outer membrane murein-binding lipoprotein Lpp